MGYISVTAKGVSWISFFRVINRLLSLVKLSILGRLLTPMQFGIFGIAGMVLALLEVVTETGINIFLVQSKKDIKVYVNSAWVISIVRGFLLSLLIILVTPFVVTFFAIPDATNIVLLTAVIPLIRGFINPAIISYHKDLLFRKVFVFRTVLLLADVSVSLLIAYYTRSAVSFVWGLIVSAIFEVIMSFLFVPVKPKLSFELAKLKLIIAKGWWVTLNGIFGYLADNGDNITVGKLLGSANLGIYQVAYKLSTLSISEITDVINQVMFPVYSKFSDDRRRLQKAFIKVTVFSGFGAFIIALVLFFFAEQIIVFAMGEQWVQAIPLVKILAVYGLLRTLLGNVQPLFYALQKQDYVTKITFIRVSVLLISIIPMVYMYGMFGAAYAMVLSIIVEIPLSLFYIKKELYG